MTSVEKCDVAAAAVVLLVGVETLSRVLLLSSSRHSRFRSPEACAHELYARSEMRPVRMKMMNHKGRVSLQTHPSQ